MKKEQLVKIFKKTGDVVRTNLTDLGAAFLPAAGGKEEVLPSKIRKAEEKKQG